MKFLTYEEAIEKGEVFCWAGGHKIAQAKRFDKNTKFVIENQNALHNVVQIMVNNNKKVIQININKSIEAIGNIADFKKGIGAI